MRAIQIVGRKKSGKTALVEALIPLLRRRGLRVGTVKHSSHPHPLDREGSDSWRHRAAGAEATLAISAASVSLHLPAPGAAAETEALLERYLGDCDLVLIEGWRDRHGPRIEVLPAGRQGQPRPPRYGQAGTLLAVVLADGLRPAPAEMAALDLGAPWFLWRDREAVADLIAGHRPARGCR
ncbi:MAG: molybdopterin-guanine dinucleotide biosynthesis protein B [Candidatus Eisenbacteria bacterium]|nr:molybdopterin-guanine dinucleotide biosynthesis protein B [Candidatus Eisenbacteria bacterium]